jgi:hypothetical protein
MSSLYIWRLSRQSNLQKEREREREREREIKDRIIPDDKVQKIGLNVRSNCLYSGKRPECLQGPIR